MWDLGVREANDTSATGKEGEMFNMLTAVYLNVLSDESPFKDLPRTHLYVIRRTQDAYLKSTHEAYLGARISKCGLDKSET